MIATATVVALVLLLVLGGVGGARLLAAAPATLSVYPRLGMSLWVLAVTLWVTGLLLLGPMLTWIVAGPALPGGVGLACQRCLDAANPFTHPVWNLGIPSAILLAAPLLLVTAFTLRASVRYLLGRRRLRGFRRAVQRSSERRTLHGIDARVTSETAPDAYSVPGLGVVVSQATLSLLTDAELATVLEHERAHLAQRHHLLLGAVATLRDVLGWVPLVRAAPAAVAAYAEMAADDAARRSGGTTALASALLRLGRVGPVAGSPGRPAAVLHAASGNPTWRVRRLALDAPPPVAPVARIGGWLATFTVVIVAVALPYIGVLLAGTC